MTAETSHRRRAKGQAANRSRQARRTGNAKRVYYFGPDRVEGEATMTDLLGGKGANLAETTRIGLPVPPGFTITTEACARFHERGRRMPTGLIEEVRHHLRRLEEDTDKRFGDKHNPLLLAVRSGAAASMPGMMDTVLNVGLTDETVDGLGRLTHDPRFARDAYRRLIAMFGNVVMGIDAEAFERPLQDLKQQHAAATDAELDADALEGLIDAYKQIYRQRARRAFPQDPDDQLVQAIEAVFRSWNTPRAIRYRQINRLTGLLGTAANVQAMVFGNLGEDSGSGVAFTRDPATGANKLYGEFLLNAQGEDVVAGTRTPLPVRAMSGKWRQVYRQLIDIKDRLEQHYKEMQDFEFTVERGTLYLLQTRRGARTGPAAVKIACDMVRQKLIDEPTAVLRVPASDLNQLLLPSFDPAAAREVLARGLPASPGAATGRPAFTAEEAGARAKAGERVLLVREQTSADDVEGIHAATGILTSTGGMTSHAAVVARGWGKPCVAGAAAVMIDRAQQRITIDGRSLGVDDTLSIDGSTGQVMLGELPMQHPAVSGDFARLMRWADRYRRLGVRANADTAPDAERARQFGAEGIGLCRTEHMFFAEPRLRAMQEMILAEVSEARRAALAKLLPHQREDFISLFTAMKGRVVTIRLLDPPLHEFLPRREDAQKQMAEDLGLTLEAIRRRLAALHETNPMLGHRGCRVAVSYPEVLEMQVRAVVEAAIECRRHRLRARPEIMIPLVADASELRHLRERIERHIEQVARECGYRGQLRIPVGTMIEVPRAALTAGAIAAHADFFSFGTNDLTQLTFGYSRDDAGRFLPEYLEKGLLDRDPFQSLDVAGVGELVQLGTQRGRAVRAELKVGLCGEHGGDPDSIDACHRMGLDYVSCSPFRVPVARLAAAQAAVRARRSEAPADKPDSRD